MRLVSLAAALALVSPAAQAQTPVPAPAPAPSPPASNPAYAQDVASMDAILAALYASISGDKGVARDWNRFRNLFHPTARLMPSGTNREGQGVVRSITPEEYLERSGPVLVRDGFHEREIARHVDRFGRVVQVFSTYDSRRAASDAQPFMRGINSIQLFDDGQRWWVLSIYWQQETPETPIPAEYLPAS